MESKELTNEEKFQADRLAKLQFQEIRNNRESMRLLNEKFRELDKLKLIPCSYGHDLIEIYNLNYTGIAEKCILQIFDDIKSGRINLKEH